MATVSEFRQFFGEGFKLKNRTFIVRHGLVRAPMRNTSLRSILCTSLVFQAESNVKQVLVTKPDPGTTSWGLVEEGRQQAKAVRPPLTTMLKIFSSGLYQIFEKIIGFI